MQEKMYDLTNPQRSIWFTEEVFKGTPISNIVGTVFVHEKVNFKLLEQAINIFVEKNDSYRLKFIIDNKNVHQFVVPYSKFSLKLVDVHNDKGLKKLEKEIVTTTFDVLNNFVFTFTLFRLDDGTGGFVLNSHHLISDAWTSGFTRF